MLKVKATALHPAWLQPDWPVPAGVRAVFTTRAGGVSQVPWDSLNLGSHVGDQPAAVAANRALLQAATGVPSAYLEQVHGTAVAVLTSAAADGRVADACVTSARSVACTVLVADCLPVLLASADGSWVAAAHAGWRGLAGVGSSQGVLESVLNQTKASFNAFPQAGIGFVAIKKIVIQV